MNWSLSTRRTPEARTAPQNSTRTQIWTRVLFSEPRSCSLDSLTWINSLPRSPCHRLLSKKSSKLRQSDVSFTLEHGRCGSPRAPLSSSENPKLKDPHETVLHRKPWCGQTLPTFLEFQILEPRNGRARQRFSSQDTVLKRLIFD